MLRRQQNPRKGRRHVAKDNKSGSVSKKDNQGGASRFSSLETEGLNEKERESDEIVRRSLEDVTNVRRGKEERKADLGKLNRATMMEEERERTRKGEKAES